MPLGTSIVRIENPMNFNESFTTAGIGGWTCFGCPWPIYLVNINVKSSKRTKFAANIKSI